MDLLSLSSCDLILGPFWSFPGIGKLHDEASTSGGRDQRQKISSPSECSQFRNVV